MRKIGIGIIGLGNIGSRLYKEILSKKKDIGLKTNTKIIFSSSDKAYGTMQKQNYTEDDRLHGDFPYDVSKSSSDLIAQSYSKTYNLSVAIIRSGNIFGQADFNLDRLI